MKILIYSTKVFERSYLESSASPDYHVIMTDKALSMETANLAKGFDVISIFTGDDASAEVLELLKEGGVQYIAVRAAGYDNVDIQKAGRLGIRIANVPEYSPFAIAEHALALMLALNRKLVQSNQQVQQHDFTVNKLVGFDLHGKTIGIIGTGKIGRTLIKILSGFGCRLLGYDIHENQELVTKYGLEYVSLTSLCREADIISIHTNLDTNTRYMINWKLISLMKQGVMLINTSRGACVKTEDVLHFLENGHIGYYGADVYEKERGLFFYDWTEKELTDETLKKLLALPNVLITPHQAFATKEALKNIAQTTFENISCWNNDKRCKNELIPVHVITANLGKSHTGEIESNQTTYYL